MDESAYNSQIEKLATILIADKISPDEQDPKIINKYFEFAKKEFSLNNETALQLLYETLLYLKMKQSDNIDPLQQADKFGAGFS